MRPARLSGGARPLLVVDDDETLRRLLFSMLTDEGYAVMEASDGAVALARIHKAAPSLILLDMRMPVMDGWEFARRYRALPGPQAPIICLTAAVDAAARGTQIDAAATLSKPFDLEDLLALVGRYVPSPVDEAP